jgi:hypothetical protein
MSIFKTLDIHAILPQCTMYHLENSSRTLCCMSRRKWRSGRPKMFDEITQFKEFQFVNAQRGHESDEVWRILEYRQQTGVCVHIGYFDFGENPGLGAMDPRTADQ